MLLKALLVVHQIEFPKTHDIDELLDLVKKVDPGQAAALREAARLTPYGVDIRYPDEAPEIGPDGAREAFRLATLVYDAVVPILKACIGDAKG